MATVVDRRQQEKNALLVMCDFSPPRGSDSCLMEPSVHLKADFISVAYSPGKSSRVSSPFAAHWIREHTNSDVVFTVATRDMNKVAMQSLLMGASLMGLENMVVVKGDIFSGEELKMVKAVNDFTPTALIKASIEMNHGLDFKGLELRTPTSFCVGATIDLGREFNRELELTRRKVKAGAQYFLLQPLFEPGKLNSFVERYAELYGEDLTSPIFCGVQIMVPKSQMFGVIPEWVDEDLAKGRTGVEIALQVMEKYMDLGFNSMYLVPPVFKGGRRDYEVAQSILEGLGR